MGRETIDARKLDARHETLDSSLVSSLSSATPRFMPHVSRPNLPTQRKANDHD